MRALFLIPVHQPLSGHNLHEFENGAVLRRAPPTDDLVNLSHGCWSDAPQHGQNLEFGVGWPARFVCHSTNNLLVIVSYVKNSLIRRQTPGAQTGLSVPLRANAEGAASRPLQEERSFDFAQDD